MPSGSLSNLNVAFSFGLSRAVKVKHSKPLRSIESLFCRHSPGGFVLGSTGEVLSYSRNRSNRTNMATTGATVAAGDMVVDSLLSNYGNVSGLPKPGGVFFNDRSYKMCGKASVCMRRVVRHYGVRGLPVLDFEQRSNGFSALLLGGLNNCRNVSSSCHSDGVVPEISTDGSLSVEQLSSLALSAEQSPGHGSLKLVSGVCYMPHPAKEETGGEDAHFICADEQVIGVADGVGGWADVGVNAGEYARELMCNSVKAIREMPDGSVDPLHVLEKAHAETKSMGSSTACIIALKNQDLHAINLGDSGFIIIRDGRTVFESPVQQHSFNFTYQLENSNRGDQPRSGQIFKIPVLPGDIVVAGSDGLFDNLYNNEIAAVVADAVEGDLGPDATAQKIADFARRRALDRKHRTPFSTAAQEAGFAYYGGKLDDLTVLVSFISSSMSA